MSAAQERRGIAGATAGAGAAAGDVTEAEAAEAKAWTEIFTLFQQSGCDDRGAAYATSMGTLRRRAEELEHQLEALRFQEGRLLHFAREEVKVDAAAAKGAAQAAQEAARAWGRTLAEKLDAHARRARFRQLLAEPPWQAAALADDVHGEAVQRIESQQQEEVEAKERFASEAKAQEQASAEVEKRIRNDVGEAQRTALATQGLNSRRFPLRPGLPPCGYFLRKGTCKRAKVCMWDHPEPDTNSMGYPLRPGQHMCALYRRTKTCKFGALCMYDHPESALKEEEPDQPGTLPVALAKVAAQQHQMQLLLHLQLLQEMDMLEDPEAMMNSWLRFRTTFSMNG